MELAGYTKRTYFFLMVLGFCVTAILVNLLSFLVEITAADVVEINPEALESQLYETLDSQSILFLTTSEIIHHVSVLGPERYLAVLDDIAPATCHDTAHVVGDLVFLSTESIPESLSLCSNTCMSGCIHGALLSAAGRNISEEGSQAGHLELDDFVDSIDTICDTDSVQSHLEGTCIHGVGHALMSLSPVTTVAFSYCSRFLDIRKKYYCLTGAYMELIEGGYDLPLATSLEGSCYRHGLFAEYPAACMRYMVTNYAIATNKKPEQIRESCLLIQDSAERNGCFHGLGRYISDAVARGESSIQTCVSDDSQASWLCVDAVGELVSEMGVLDTHAICGELSVYLELFTACSEAMDRGLYSLEKDFTAYVGENNH